MKFDVWSRDVLDGFIDISKGVATFQNRRPFFASGIIRPKNEPRVRFPAMNLCIDNKIDMKKQDRDHDLRENYIAYVLFAFWYSKSH
jgi:hypothetical protein